MHTELLSMEALGMSDGAVVAIVTGCVSIVATIVAFLTLWVKLKYGVEKTVAVETKLDANTALTKAGTDAAAGAAAKAERKAEEAVLKVEAVDDKANTIVHQTNGTQEVLKTLVTTLLSKVTELGEHTRTGNHRVLDGVNLVIVKLSEMAALQKVVVGVPLVVPPAPSLPFSPTSEVKVKP